MRLRYIVTRFNIVLVTFVISSSLHFILFGVPLSVNIVPRIRIILNKQSREFDIVPTIF